MSVAPDGSPESGAVASAAAAPAIGAVTVNGAVVALAAPRSVATLLAELGYRDRFVAVARNREHVRRADFDEVMVHDGDEIDILAPMAGG